MKYNTNLSTPDSHFDSMSVKVLLEFHENILVVLPARPRDESAGAWKKCQNSTWGRGGEEMCLGNRRAPSCF